MQPMPVALRAARAIPKQSRPTSRRRPARGPAALRNLPSSPFFKEGIIQESRILLFSIWALLFVPTASSPLWKRGDRGDFRWFALDPIIFPQLPFVEGGKRGTCLWVFRLDRIDNLPLLKGDRGLFDDHFIPVKPCLNIN